MDNLIEQISNYISEEKKNIQKISIYEAQAFSPVTFDRLGLISNISSPKELWKFMDSMHSYGFKKNFFYGLKNKLTLEEIELLRYCLKKSLKVLDLINSPQKFLPLNSISRALISYRFIKSKINKNENIIEWGPGSGFLGLMMLKSGYRYSAIDIAMGFFFIQKLIWNNEQKHNEFRHFKWWEWLSESPNSNNVIIANHMLAEMHPSSLNFNLKNNSITKKNYKYFFESFGHSDQPESVSKAFLKYENEIKYYINRSINEYNLYQGYFSNNKQIKRSLGIQNYFPNFKSIFKIRFYEKIIKKLIFRQHYEYIFNPYYHTANILNNNENEKTEFKFEKDTALNIVNEIIKSEFKDIATESPDYKFLK